MRACLHYVDDRRVDDRRVDDRRVDNGRVDDGLIEVLHEIVQNPQ